MMRGASVQPTSFQLSRSQPVVTIKCNGEELQKGHMQASGSQLNGQVGVHPEAGKVEIRNLRLKETS